MTSSSGSTTSLSAPASCQIGRSPVLPIDPTADRSRRAWLPCPCCDHATKCDDCHERKNCATHWQYLLSNKGTLVHLQCSDCGYLWSTDTRKRARRQRRAA
jgi:hypothetical protein